MKSRNKIPDNLDNEKKMYLIKCSLAEKVREMRLEKGYSQEKLASASGCSSKTISNIETGSKFPDFETISKLSVVLDCDIDYLTGRIEEKHHGNKEITEAIGLSEESIEVLRKCRKNIIPHYENGELQYTAFTHDAYKVGVIDKLIREEKILNYIDEYVNEYGHDRHKYTDAENPKKATMNFFSETLRVDDFLITDEIILTSISNLLRKELDSLAKKYTDLTDGLEDLLS